MKKTLSSYLWWTHERGSFHYDVMVTLILLFIFVTPQLWNYRDRPQPPRASASEVSVKTESPGHFVYQIDAAQVRRSADVDAFLTHSVEAISGDMVIDRYEPVKAEDGRVSSYKVWAHR